ncbi:MAG: peptidylprolyl isomerase [bacterium]
MRARAEHRAAASEATVRIYMIFLVAGVAGLLGCTPTEGPADPVIGQINGQPVQRGAFLEAIVLDQGEAFFARYAERLIVEAAAREAGVTVDAAAVEKAVDEEIQDQITQRFGGDRAALDARLARYGQTYDRWREGRLRDRRVLMLAHAVLETRIDPKRVDALFEQRYGAGGVKRQIRQIFISAQVPASRFYPQSEYEAEREVVEAEGRERAFALHRQLQRGASFEALARESSDDRSAADGGLLGVHWSGRFGARFDEAVRTLAPGALSEVVEGREGYHIIRVDGVRKGARYEGRAILVSAQRRGEDDPADEAARFSAALDRATALRGRIAGGEDFAEVARAESSDRATGQKGGELGAFGPGRLGLEADAVLETMPLNAPSSPIRTPEGYVIMELSKREFIPAQDKKLVRHILVSTQYSRVKARRLADSLPGLAKAKAEKLLADVQGGAELGELARLESEDELSRRSGGMLAGIRVDQLGDAVRQALDSMKPGEVRLVESERGFHVIELQSATRSDPAAVRAELEAELKRTPVSDAEARAWIGELRDKATIQVDIEKALAGPRLTPTPRRAPPTAFFPATHPRSGPRSVGRDPPCGHPRRRTEYVGGGGVRGHHRWNSRWVDRPSMSAGEGVRAAVWLEFRCPRLGCWRGFDPFWVANGGLRERPGHGRTARLNG